jgi:cell division protein ZapA (FtsZ GTPase activity inhibitor)
MTKKISISLIIILMASILLIGCQQQAARRPADPNNNQTDMNNEMTENERRVLAGRLSNLAEEIEGVKNASVIVSSIGMTQNDNMNNNQNTNTAPNNMTGTMPRSALPNDPINNNMNPGNATGTNANNSNRINNEQGMNTRDNLTPSPGLTNNMDTNNNNRTGLVVMVGLTMEDNINNDANKIKSIKQTVANRLRGADSRITQVLVTSDPGLIEKINDIAAGLLEGRPIRSFDNDIKNLGNDLRREMPAF